MAAFAALGPASSMLQTFQNLTWRELVFSLKSFAAAVLALYISLRLDFSQPMWSVTTVYIVAQPLAGMVLSKSVYRVLGTVIGAAASLAFVALFSNSPELFCLVLALWIGLGTTITIYLRDAPQAYVGMLSGYSAAIIGLPAALAPEVAFEYATSRCLEIMVGIGCATLMHHLIFPQRAGDALRKALDATLPSMARWAQDALQGKQSEVTGLLDRRRILNAVVSLDLLRIFATFDTPAIRVVDPAIRQFEGTLLSLLAMLMSVYDRFAALVQERPATADALRPLLAQVADHMAKSAETKATANTEAEQFDEAALRRDLNAHLPDIATLRVDTRSFLVRSMLLRLGDVLDLWRDVVWLRTHIARGQRLPPDTPTPSRRPHRDFATALLGGGIAALAVLLTSAFWILSAWPNGWTAVIFAGIICAIMGGRDNPAAASTIFLWMSLAGIPIAAFYLFVILPPLSGFAALAIAFAPFYLVTGALLAVPRAIPFTLPLILTAGGLMPIVNTMTYDFAAFLNSAIGFIGGTGIGVLTLALFWPLRTDWAVQRLMCATFADLAAIGHGNIDRPAFESRMFDRSNALFARLDPMKADERAIMQGSLGSLRLGLNMITLHRLRYSLPTAAVRTITNALADIAEYFTRASHNALGATPLPALSRASAELLHSDDSPLVLRAAESLYNIDMLMKRHAIFFGQPTADATFQPQPVTA
ncbi:putative transmembrane protein [Afipia carboxidovorans OM5]|uniref:Putative transmembrane protein n=2 Tax=Afipia carboxidovorans TaxID=40137 RepID=F8BSR1_AFIC5|nr:putative transmembrane protein [Afipia carboxidovorans OM4]AEI04938.1 putative transmembrane protein [Afipia carboxidovorans OM5]